MCKTTSSFANDNSLGCGCSCKGGTGLAGASDEENNGAEKTTDDLFNTAKDYINDEIPTRYKVGAIALIVGSVWFRSRCR